MADSSKGWKEGEELRRYLAELSEESRRIREQSEALNKRILELKDRIDRDHGRLPPTKSN